MPLSSKYNILDTLHENSSTIVYRAVRKSDKKKFILKVLKPSAKNEYTLYEFINEQKILENIKLKKVIRFVELISTPTDYIHVFEDIGGSSLYDLLSHKKFTLHESLDISLALVKTLHILHQKFIIHADLNPKNIIYNPQTQELQIIDFGHSILRQKSVFNEDIVQGASANLFYISPEQTGLTNQVIDHRSDLYSLGMSLYHLFLGQSPFKAKDKEELLHMQIALTPEPLHSIQKEIPYTLSKIISKLIHKRPQERYQNDEALVHDIRTCVSRINKKGEIEDFKIALHDYPIIHIGEKLFGRELQTSVLKNISKSTKGIKLLISGHSGVGKTRLVQEFFSYFPSDFLILEAKFEQFKDPSPYLSFKQLFKGLISHTNTLDFSSLKADDSSLLRFIFPELDIFLPSNKKHISYMHQDINLQLPLAIKNFFDLLALQNKGLIIFIDDLQWADEVSIKLITALLIDNNNNNLHFITSYRDNEVNHESNAAGLISQLQFNKKYLCTCIELKPLIADSVKEMTHSLFHLEGKKLQDLSELLYKKTNGNPFYLKTLLQFLMKEEELFFEKGRWKYNLQAIIQHPSTINMVSLINEKFTKLRVEQQRYLQYLSLLGSRYDLYQARIMMQSLGYSEDILYELEIEGFIEQYPKEYQFVHDQIQQNIFNSLDQTLKRKFHKHISNFFQKQKKSDINSLTLAYHLNNAYSPYAYPKKLLPINIKALEELLLHHAYKNALEKVQWMQVYLFKEDLWESNFTLSFNFSYLKARVFYLNTLQDKAYKEISQLIHKARNLQQKILCFNLLKDICVTKGEHFNELKQRATELLKALGLEVPQENNKVQLVQNLHDILKKSFLYSTPAKILKLPKLQNTQKKKALSLLVNFWEIAYYLRDIELMQWSVLNIIQTSFKYGNSNESSFAYVLYGAQLSSSKSYKMASIFGDLALRLNQSLKDKDLLPAVHNFVANFINPYTKPLSSNISLYQKSLHQSKLNGNIVFGTWANFLMHFSNFLAGTNLEKVKENISKESDFILNSGDEKMISIFLVLNHAIDSLQDNISEENNKEKEYIKLWEKEKFYPALAWFGIIKAQSCFLKNEINQGLSYLNTYVHNTDNDLIMFPKIRFHFIRALLLMAKEKNLSKQEQAFLEQDLENFNSYIKQSPKNFKFQILLLKAEQIKNTSSPWDVAKLYDQSLSIARKEKNSFHLSLASLCASAFFKHLELNDLYKFYTDTAIVSLQQWGAFAPAKYLKNIEVKQSTKKSILDTYSLASDSSKDFSTEVNFKSLIKSFNAISKAQDNEELIHTLMKTIVKNATASKAILLFKEKNIFKIKAEYNFKKAKMQFCDISYEHSDLSPKNLLTYVINTKQALTLFNPGESGKFQFDDYIKKHKPASSLVIPSINEGSVSALLYLENEDIATPLNEDKRQSLSLLLTQASIVFKNTSLFENIKQSEDKLTKAQEISNVGSWEYNTATQAITWSAQTYRIYELEPFSISIDRDWFSSHLHPDDIEFITQKADDSLAGKSTYDVVHRIITTEGKIKKVHQKAEIFLENNVVIMSGTIQDITESEEAKEEISRLSQVVNQSPYTTIITDKQGYISYVNEQTLIMSGYTRKELLGNKMNIFRSFVHSDDFYEDMWHAIQDKKEIWKGTFINKMKDGRLLDCQSTIFPIVNKHQEIINYITIQEDKTQENIKDKLFLMQTRQAQMGEMLSMIAHQWRQPLAIISSLINGQRVDIALDNINLEEISKSYIDMETQVVHLSKTISDFRDFFKPDKEAVLTKNSILVQKVLNLIEHSLSQNSIEVKLSVINDISYTSFESELEQVVLNLLKNSQDAFVHKNIKNPLIEITFDKIKDHAVLIIEDNAKGIDKEVVDTLFLPYISTKTKKHGTGLGLYMSKTIVEEHCKGKIEVVNTNKGAKFSIYIPLKDSYA